MQDERKLIPVMREGIEVIKMIFFKELKTHLLRKYPDREPSYIGKLSGAIINDLFGTPTTGEPFAAFAEENKDHIEKEMKSLADELGKMRIPLTDALRIQFLCDSRDGIDSTSVLRRANELGILMVDREIPLPGQFMNLVRKLGGAFDLLAH